ncbi:MAG: hypothetical protein R2794_06955 [Chitinophagales bacterium]
MSKGKTEIGNLAGYLSLIVMRSLRSLFVIIFCSPALLFGQSSWTLTPVFDSILNIAGRGDTIWMATQNAGIAFFSLGSGQKGYLDPTNSALQEWDMRSICLTGDAMYAGGNTTGLYVIKGAEVVHYDSLLSLLPGNSVTSIIADPLSDTVYMATNKGLVKWLDGVSAIYDSAHSEIGADMLTKLFFDSQHNLWIGTRHNGVTKFDGTTFTNYNFDNAGINDNWVKCMAEDSYGIYFADYLGVDKYPAGDDWLLFIIHLQHPCKAVK